MAWLDKRKNKQGGIRWRVCDRVDGKKVTVVKNAGAWKEIANVRMIAYNKEKAATGTDLMPKQRLPIEEMCDFYLQFHGRTLKGGFSDHYRSAYYGMRLRMEQIKRFWKGRFADEITKVHVQEFMGQFNTAGTRMRWLGVLGNMFRLISDWNEEGNILPHKYLLPPNNPVSKCRKEMKSSEKRELPDTRVLSKEEWERFSKCLTPRARRICEIALSRFLRLADIKAISHLSIVDGHIKGLQQKTGDPFSVPVLADQATKYDFTNFHREFTLAQIKAGLHHPPEHPLHFSAKDLRRTGATWAYRKSGDLVAISRMLGHRKLSTTERYLLIDAADIQRIAKFMDSFVNSHGARVEHFPTSDEKGAH